MSGGEPAAAALDPATAEVGDTHQEVVVDGLTRTQIVQYAGASGDFNPLHTDEVFATQVAGYPSVFAHGMLTMAMTGRMLTSAIGGGHLARFGGRFTAPVWPGDTLTVTATVTAVTAVDEGTDRGAAVGERAVELEVVTRNQHGQAVFAGSAAAAR